MTYDSKIQWTDHTWNPWQGCIKVSPGCKYCYMYRDKDRWKQDPVTPVRSKPSTFNFPRSIKRSGKVFTCSWSDFFIEHADDWRKEAWDIITSTPHLTYQILTKRPERIMDTIPYLPPNVWLGVSAEDQENLAKRWNIMSEVKQRFPGTYFISMEPLLGPIDLMNYIESSMPWDPVPDWVIIGGESGNDHGKYRYRECSLEWMDHIIFDCQEYNIPIFIKQLGTHLSKKLGLKDRHGGNILEWPEDLISYRQFPSTQSAVS